ncbi:MAG: cytochrome c3 family protein [bacterium]
MGSRNTIQKLKFKMKNCRTASRRNFKPEKHHILHFAFCIFYFIFPASSLIYASGIVETVHNLEVNTEWAGGVELEGVCAYCHIPHSAVGSQIWPYKPREKDYGDFGSVSRVCYICHGTSLAGTKAKKIFTVFNVKRANHPVGFASYETPNVENTDWLGEVVDTPAQEWPETEKEKSIQCTTCHNPHDNINGNFMRAMMYDSVQEEGNFSNYKGPVQNFCSYCHQQREDSGKKSDNGVREIPDSGTHPAGHSVSRENARNGGAGIILDSIFTQPKGVLGGHLSYFTQGGIICMTCHQVHGAEPVQDGLYMDNTPLRVGPLLVVNNDTVGSVPGESLLCEKCHTEMPAVDTAGNKHTHPVNKFPTPTDDNFSSNVTPYTEREFGNEKGTPLSIHYPFNEADNSQWIDYEESGEPNTLPANFERTMGEYLICMSCHDPHGAKAGSPILRANSSDIFCEDCHGRKPRYNDYNNFLNPISEEMGTQIKGTKEVWGVSHPVNVPMMSRDRLRMAIRDSLINSEGILLQNIRSKINLVDNKVVCRTCHLAHTGEDNYLLAVTDDNSEICEACHTNEKNPHNPSVYYFEGLDSLQSKDPTEDFDTLRLGSHYIGDVTTNRNEFTREGIIIKQEDHSDWLGTAHVNDYREKNRPWAFSKQYTHIGGPGGDRKRDGYDEIKKYPHVICQSCHTPHGAATGLSDSPGEDRLLLDINNYSQMCNDCHTPPGSHPVMGDILGGKNKQLSILDSMIVQDEVSMLPCDYPVGWQDGEYTNNKGQVVRWNQTPGAPRHLVCESCHSLHSAANSPGAYVLEEGEGNINREGGYIYKPTKLDFYPLCKKCHLQGQY